MRQRPRAQRGDPCMAVIGYATAHANLSGAQGISGQSTRRRYGRNHRVFLEIPRCRGDTGLSSVEICMDQRGSSQSSGAHDQVASRDGLSLGFWTEQRLLKVVDPCPDHDRRRVRSSIKDRGGTCRGTSLVSVCSSNEIGPITFDAR